LQEIPIDKFKKMSMPASGMIDRTINFILVFCHLQVWVKPFHDQ
jgi:hypothetical protein